MRKIKWENLVFILLVVLGVLSIKHHIELNGIYALLGIEPLMYGMFAFGFRAIVKDIRKNPDNWKI